ncbi:MAG: prepilin-type N-terminal cleavage/methylation domain-containing protein [Trueperaceae bacterium]|nr:prepilin-type N-terminal cleavage/methylation domain-containing protein [Trueperaceae bacterium]
MTTSMGRRRRCLARRIDAQRGFTIIEAIIAVAVIGIIVVGVLPLFINYARINTESEFRTGAVTAAQQVMDRLRFEPFTGWVASGTVQSIDTDLRTYDVTITYCTAELTLCQSGSRHVRLEVANSGRTYYTVESVFSRFE